MTRRQAIIGANELLGLSHAATPGPWALDREFHRGSITVAAGPLLTETKVLLQPNHNFPEEAQRNVMFVAFARNHVAEILEALLREVENA